MITSRWELVTLNQALTSRMSLEELADALIRRMGTSLGKVVDDQIGE